MAILHNDDFGYRAISVSRRSNAPRHRGRYRPGPGRTSLHICCAAGLRASELIGLLVSSVSSVTLQPAPTIRVVGKERKEPALPLWKQTAVDLRAWLAVRGDPPTPELFVNARGQALTRVGFAFLLDQHAQATKDRCPSLRDNQMPPHVLRHPNPTCPGQDLTGYFWIFSCYNVFLEIFSLGMHTFLSPRRSVVLIANTVAISCALLFSSNVWAEPKVKAADPRETRGLRASLDRSDCPGAVQAVKAGIKARQPDVLMMAGTLMAEGICMKANWEKAVTLYEMAYQEGSPTAWYAIIAALAVPGRDNGRALWYAAQSWRPQGLPSGCIPTADPIKELDAFNTQLEHMAPDLFKACVYMVGVTNEVFGHAQFPPGALYYNVQGNLIMKFTPSSGTIAWTFEPTANSLANYIATGSDQFDDDRKVDKLLLTYVTEKGNYALGRYARPDGIDPGIVLSSMFVFTITNQ